MTWLALWFALQAGLSPNSMMVDYPLKDQMFYPDTGYIELSAELRFFDGHFFIGGSARIEVQKNVLPDFSFTPEMLASGFNAGLRFGGLEIGALYSCQHPVVPYYDYYKPILVWDGWYGEVYVKFSGETKLF